jgi:dipeptidyl aminopeptidase/acylaminoacyl peptidase
MIATSFVLVAALALTAYLGICGFVAHRFTRTRRQHPQLSEHEAASGVRAVSFAARDGRARIDAWYFAAEPHTGAVIFVHGKDTCRGDELKSPTVALARQLVAAGLSVLMIDLRGHGTSSDARVTYGASERHDVLGAVDWLRAQGHARIGVLGASMGAATSLLAAADEPEIIALVADSAFTDFGLMIERQYRKLSHLPHCFLPGALAVGRLVTGVRLEEVCPLAAARSLHGRPMLVIHTEGDRFIPAEDASALASAAGAELWITAGTRHLGSYASDPTAYAARVTGFFGRHLLGIAP